MRSSSKTLLALGDALSGAAGTAVSTIATYPLDLVNTRLKIQGQLAQQQTQPKDDVGKNAKGVKIGQDERVPEPIQYEGILDAFRVIYSREGGLSAFLAGLGPDIAKSMADSFLFFLFYSWFRAQARAMRMAPQLATGQPRKNLDLRAWEELAVGTVAGACARLFTTPIGNVVMRNQMAALISASGSSHDTLPNRNAEGIQPASHEPSAREILAQIMAEKGVLGLWAGYSATLVLTLNPSLTFFLHQTLQRNVLTREQCDNPGSVLTFLMAAMSKVAATAATYPFQIAKARAQVSRPPLGDQDVHMDGQTGREGKQGSQPDRAKSAKEGAKRTLVSSVAVVKGGLGNLMDESIFAKVTKIAKFEGVSALYDGLGGELLKSFFSHGTTMLTKDLLHKLVIKLYFMLMIVSQRMLSQRRVISNRTRRISAQASATLRGSIAKYSSLVN